MSGKTGESEREFSISDSFFLADPKAVLRDVIWVRKITTVNQSVSHHQTFLRLTWIIRVHSNIFVDTLALARPTCSPIHATSWVVMRMSRPMTIDQTESPTANSYRCDRTRPIVR